MNTYMIIDLPIGRSHNVVVNEERNYAVAVGAAPRTDACASGLIFINMDDPANPYSPGCAPQDGESTSRILEGAIADYLKATSTTLNASSTADQTKSTTAATSATVTTRTLSRSTMSPTRKVPTQPPSSPKRHTQERPTP